MNIVIMAGGGGTRLWPVSREKIPKQFARLVGNKTLLQQTFARAQKVTRTVENIVVTTRTVYVPEVRRQLPHLPKDHILAEPVKRDTAASVGMAAAFFAARGNDDQPLIMMPSDHLVGNEPLFRLALRAAGVLLREHPDRTVLFGSEPTYPETSLGYIERGSRVGLTLGIPVYAVRRFTEKPKLGLAKRYLATGRFLWNMGIYGWRVDTLLGLFHRHQPSIARRLDRIQQLFADRSSGSALGRAYAGMPSISLDYAVTEHQDPGNVLVLPGAYEWSDVGHWASLAEVLGGKVGEEVKSGKVLQVKSSGNFVYSDVEKVVGLVGVQNLIVVATPDAFLVCDKANAQDVKALVAELKRRGYHKFL